MRYILTAILTAGALLSPAYAAATPDKAAASQWLRDALPDALQLGSFLGLEYWQWLGLIVLIFLGFVADQVARLIFRPLVRRLAQRFYREVDDGLIKTAVRAIGLFCGALVWMVFVRLLDLQGNVSDIARAAVGIYAVLIGAHMGLKLTDLLSEILGNLARSTENKFDDILVPLLRKTLKVFIIALGVIYGAQTFKINIVPLVTGLGIGGLAFAFAAKDTIENFFGSITVILDRPFEVGDWVVVGDVEGTVEDLGMRSTRIRTFYNSLVTVPNATLVRATVDNLGRRTYRRWKTYLGVQYDTPPEKLLAFAEGVRELVRQHPYTRKDFYQVWWNDFAGYSLNLLLYVFFQAPDWSTELRERERLFVDIVRLADQLGVQFAFPTQTVHLYKEEHASHESRYAVPAGSNDADAMQTGARLAQEITAAQPWQKEKPGPVEYKTGEGFHSEHEHRGS